MWLPVPRSRKLRNIFLLNEDEAYDFATCSDNEAAVVVMLDIIFMSLFATKLMLHSIYNVKILLNLINLMIFSFVLYFHIYGYAYRYLF